MIPLPPREHIVPRTGGCKSRLCPTMGGEAGGSSYRQGPSFPPLVSRAGGPLNESGGPATPPPPRAPLSLWSWGSEAGIRATGGGVRPHPSPQQRETVPEGTTQGKRPRGGLVHKLTGGLLCPPHPLPT